MATSTIKSTGTISKATGKYTTAQWTTGTNTCVWTAPQSGMYIVWMSFTLNDVRVENRRTYKQLQMRGTAIGQVGSTLYYDTSSPDDVPFVQRIISQPVLATEGQTVIPYVHTGTADIVYDITITAIKIA